MENLPVVQNGIKDTKKLADKLEVSEYVVKMLMPQQLGWLKLAIDKKKTFEALQKDELKVQEVLKDITADNDLASVQKKIKDANDTATTSKEQRLVFTNGIKEKLTEPAMEFETRNFELIDAAKVHELALRKKENEKQQGEAAKKKEEVQFEAHVKNEHIRIGTAYQLELSKTVTQAYTSALKGPIPPDEIPAYLETVRTVLAEIKLEKFQKFPRTIEKYIDEPWVVNGKQIADKTPVYKYVNDKRAAEIYKSVEPYNPAEDLQTALNDLDVKFELYEHDFKNAKKAIAAANKKQLEVEQEITETAEQETATNKLMINVGNYTVGSPSGARTEIKKRYNIVEENTEAWAVAVLSAFIKNWAVAKTHLKVKTWGKLTLTQMGKALADIKTAKNETTFDNIKFEVSEK
jgi:hypothetical protein